VARGAFDPLASSGSPVAPGVRMASSGLLIIRGIVGIVIGILAIAWPGITIAVLVAVFAVYAVLDGITNLVLGVTDTHTHGRSWAHAVQGLIGIAAGVMTFLWPGITALVLVLFIGAWAIVTGALEIVAAVRLRRYISGEWLLALSGILSLVFGVLVFFFPAAGAFGIAFGLGLYAAAAGVVLVALGVRLRASTRARV
jgi:uncharacterized membrane protein HdeD (DUF308 family)